MNDSDIKRLWIYCQEAWGSTFTIPEDAVRREVKLQHWRDVLGDLDANLIRRTVVGLDVHFAPTPSELRACALDRMRFESGARALPDSDEALSELMRLIGRYGYTNEAAALAAATAFSPALKAVIDAMSWAEICADENPAVFRGQFRHLYEVAAGRIKREAAVPAPALARADLAELPS